MTIRISENFKREEFECQCGCGYDTVDIELITVLERIRTHFGKPVMITSGARCYEHNERVGGVKTSMHRVGKAVDFHVQGVRLDYVIQFLRIHYPKTYGIGEYRNWIHFDVRAKRARWNG